MSDLDPLDHAFASLTRDLAHAHAPGAAAAISTARRQRRTRVGAVALVAVAALGGGMTLPGLASSRDGVAADGGSARLTAAALGRAAEGWTTGWEDWQRYSPKGGGGFSVPCPSTGPEDDVSGPEPQEYGISRFVADQRASATFVLEDYADAATAARAQQLALPLHDGCGQTTDYIDVDGVRVRHDSAPDGASDGSSLWLGDVWSARIGTERGRLEVVTGDEVADDATAKDVAEALVAGIRDGWTQSGTAPTS
ncbi:MAG: hypothetical protein ACKOVB_22865 [Terrabacter sp.]